MIWEYRCTQKIIRTSATHDVTVVYVFDITGNPMGAPVTEFSIASTDVDGFEPGEQVTLRIARQGEA